MKNQQVCLTDSVHAKKLNNFIVINIFGLHLAVRQGQPSIITHAVQVCITAGKGAWRDVAARIHKVVRRVASVAIR